MFRKLAEGQVSAAENCKVIYRSNWIRCWDQWLDIPTNEKLRIFLILTPDLVFPINRQHQLCNIISATSALQVVAKEAKSRARLS